MIQLTCTNCKTVLTMDDAFAGGVCRCQHCGTIQTVPSRLKQQAVEGAEPAAARSTAKSLYQRRSRAEVGTGLDDLADAVASSGISSSGLGSGHLSPKQKVAVAKANRTQTMIAIAAAVIVLLLGAVVWLLMRPPTVASPIQSQNATDAQVESTDTGDPAFLNVKLDGDTIIYLVDRGSGTQKAFGDLKQAVLRSIQTIGPDRKFQIIFWNNGSEEAFPSGSPTYATRPNVEGAKRSVENVFAFGKTDVASGLKKAMSAKPTTVVLVTGKAWDLDDAFAEKVLSAREGSDTRIHTVAIGGNGQSSAFKTVAEKTGGECRELTEGELRAMLR